MIEGVAQEVHVAALEPRLRHHLAHRRAQAGVVVGDDELDAVETAVAQGCCPVRSPSTVQRTTPPAARSIAS